MKAGKPGPTPAAVAASAAGIDFLLRSYTPDPTAASFGSEAAAALGEDPRRIFKTLMAVADGVMVAAVVPVTGHLDLKSLAAALGAKRAAMADPAAAQRRTGYVLGGISPLGQRHACTVVLDASALEFRTVLVSGGRRGLEIELSPADLEKVTAARIAPIAAP
ncbi:Cys-tRNA(Pro) deacylase [Arthrobacter sp. Br18]|uniref:Cys-tRNA(Pro) deacylase n=1 Tax=Arthrobacter sp. Br18 TaxID=1312954 RepID=UPI0004B47783|nr:Cys-tRNA(Pro) deacylase [Arthrobacter sp. Br18]